MGTKTISIMDDVHKLLLARKRSGESFSEVIREAFTKKHDIMEFAGAWKEMNDDEVEEMKNSIRELRNRSTKELLKQNDMS